MMADRERVGRDGSPSAAIFDSQSVKIAEAGGPRGFDQGSYGRDGYVSEYRGAARHRVRVVPALPSPLWRN